jgi:hypothetical protein
VLVLVLTLAAIDGRLLWCGVAISFLFYLQVHGAGMAGIQVHGAGAIQQQVSRS